MYKIVRSVELTHRLPTLHSTLSLHIQNVLHILLSILWKQLIKIEASSYALIEDQLYHRGINGNLRLCILESQYLEILHHAHEITLQSAFESMNPIINWMCLGNCKWKHIVKGSIIDISLSYSPLQVDKAKILAYPLSLILCLHY